MIQWPHDITVYLHREAVDFRKQINGLTLLIEQEMELSPFARALFVFCNKRRTQLKVIYWDDTGFCLWQKRLEKAHFHWPRKSAMDIVELQPEQWSWLLRGFDITKMRPHKSLEF